MNLLLLAGAVMFGNVPTGATMAEVQKLRPAAEFITAEPNKTACQLREHTTIDKLKLIVCYTFRDGIISEINAGYHGEDEAEANEKLRVTLASKYGKASLEECERAGSYVVNCKTLWNADGVSVMLRDNSLGDYRSISVLYTPVSSAF